MQAFLALLATKLSEIAGKYIVNFIKELTQMAQDEINRRRQVREFNNEYDAQRRADIASRM